VAKRALNAFGITFDDGFRSPVPRVAAWGPENERTAFEVFDYRQPGWSRSRDHTSPSGDRVVSATCVWLVGPDDRMTTVVSHQPARPGTSGRSVRLAAHQFHADFLRFRRNIQSASFTLLMLVLCWWCSDPAK
jgi:hypothetical protein